MLALNPGTYLLPEFLAAVCRRFDTDVFLEVLFVPAAEGVCTWRVDSEHLANRFVTDVAESDVYVSRLHVVANTEILPASTLTPLHSALLYLHSSRVRYAQLPYGYAACVSPGVRLEWLARLTSLHTWHVVTFWALL